MSGFLPGDILSMNAEAARRLMDAGSGDAALLYLWLLKAGGSYDAAGAARALRWDAGRTDAAFAELVGMGLADEGRKAPPPQVLAVEPPEYSAADITRELENKGSLFPDLVREIQRRWRVPCPAAAGSPAPGRERGSPCSPAPG